MVLVDANVLMYPAGAPHANKAHSVACLETVAAGSVDAALDAEVLQEVLHRYRAIDRWAAGRRVHDFARSIFSVILPITAETVEATRWLLDRSESLSARDALHASVVDSYGLEAICSYDRGFDDVRGVRRVEPGEIVAA